MAQNIPDFRFSEDAIAVRQFLYEFWCARGYAPNLRDAAEATGFTRRRLMQAYRELDPEKLVPLMVLNAAAGRNLPIYGDGLNVRDWLFVDDHCMALLAVLRRGAVGEKYNIGAENELSNLEMLEALCAALEEQLPAAQNPALRARGVSNYPALRVFVPDRAGHDRRYATDSSRIRGEMGWRPAHSFEDGIRRTVSWYLGNRDWCESVMAGRSSPAPSRAAIAREN